MNIVGTSNRYKLAGANPGDSLVLVLNDGTIAYIVYNDYTSLGVEGFSKTLTGKPLEMYPWTSIKKVKKEND